MPEAPLRRQAFGARVECRRFCKSCEEKAVMAGW